MHQVEERDTDHGPDVVQPLLEDQRQAGRHQYHLGAREPTKAVQVLTRVILALCCLQCA